MQLSFSVKYIRYRVLRTNFYLATQGDVVHDYAYLMHSKTAVAAACVLLPGTVLVRPTGKSCSTVNINRVQITDSPYCAIAKLTVCMCMAEL